jgi:tRNA pseudouridine38-40 synthase
MNSTNTTQRYALNLSYLGSNFHGFQKQNTLSNTIQQHLEQALSKIADKTITTTCAGRTDRGVHALNQIIHFDSDVPRSIDNWQRGSNTLLPHSMHIHWLTKVPMDFHARYCASQREYRYLIYCSPHKPLLAQDHLLWAKKPLNVEAMHAASKFWLGSHDFSTFRAADCQAKTSQRNMHAIEFHQHGSLLKITFKANAYLYHMIRLMVAALINIGNAEKPISWAEEILLAKDRQQLGPMVSANGLYLCQINYPQKWNLPMQIEHWPLLNLGE